VLGGQRESIGYQKTPLTFPKELVANPGESVTSILDKIVSQFGTYEYFYNIHGQFIFQKKQEYYTASSFIESSHDLT
jgi:hypothetical protein